MITAGVIGVQRAGLVFPTVTWNPLDKHASIALSNGDRTATKFTGAGWVSSRATLGRLTGKHYFEVRFDAFPGAFGMAGFGTLAHTLVNYVGGVDIGVGLLSNGSRFNNAASIATVDALVAGDVACFAIDRTLNKMWFRKNSLGWNTIAGGAQDPAAGTGGFAIPATITGDIYPMVSVQVSPTDQSTGRFKTSDFSFSAPSGFSSWQGN